MSKRKPQHQRYIYELRAQCEEHKLDKSVAFYVVRYGNPQSMFVGHERAMRLDWPKKYGCNHDIKFTRMRAEDYYWDVKQNKVVEIKETEKNA